MLFISKYSINLSKHKKPRSRCARSMLLRLDYSAKWHPFKKKEPNPKHNKPQFYISVQ